jgi:subtilisin family serine protease
MATPHVAAVVAIIKMYNPNATLDDVRNILAKNSQQ